jgi:nucleoside-diphosphate-sugar epimerase
VRIFVAGATGAIGRRLVPLLIAAGHVVTGTTRSPEKAWALSAAGATPAIVDVFDREALMENVHLARPQVIIQQLTDLPHRFEPATLAAALSRTARLRSEGTHNLVDAALAAGTTRMVAQSIAFAYAPGQQPYDESSPLDESDALQETVSGILALERRITETKGIEGLILRYGRLYGPGTWSNDPPEPPSLHVDAAAEAAVLAVSRGTAGIYNIADDDGTVSIRKARSALGFDPGYRSP